MSIQAGMHQTSHSEVSPALCADAMGSGALPVYATPAMVALMENAAAACITPLLAEGESSVGTAIAVEHLSATPQGAAVWARAEVVGVEGRRVDFTLTAGDEAGPIGRGSHSRVIVKSGPFLQKAAAKGTKNESV